MASYYYTYTTSTYDAQKQKEFEEWLSMWKHHQQAEVIKRAEALKQYAQQVKPTRQHIEL